MTRSSERIVVCWIRETTKQPASIQERERGPECVCAGGGGVGLLLVLLDTYGKNYYLIRFLRRDSDRVILFWLYYVIHPL
jgi:hypothetical protein